MSLGVATAPPSGETPLPSPHSAGQSIVDRSEMTLTPLASTRSACSIVGLVASSAASSETLATMPQAGSATHTLCVPPLQKPSWRAAAFVAVLGRRAAGVHLDPRRVRVEDLGRAARRRDAELERDHALGAGDGRFFWEERRQRRVDDLRHVDARQVARVGVAGDRPAAVARGAHVLGKLADREKAVVGRERVEVDELGLRRVDERQLAARRLRHERHQERHVVAGTDGGNRDRPVGRERLLVGEDRLAVGDRPHVVGAVRARGVGVAVDVEVVVDEVLHAGERHVRRAVEAALRRLDRLLVAGGGGRPGERAGEDRRDRAGAGHGLNPSTGCPSLAITRFCVGLLGSRSTMAIVDSL